MQCKQDKRRPRRIRSRPVAASLAAAWLISSASPRAVIARQNAADVGVQESARVEALLEPIRARHEIPGMVGAILSGDKVTHIAAVGVRKLGSPAQITIDDRMHIGSCTKAMTATMLAVLVEQGKLSWTTTIADVFPDLKDTMHADFRPVTLEQLLAHRGGVPTDLSADGLWRRLWQHTGAPRDQRLALLEGVVKRAPVAAPGTKFIYANGGYAIAGAMAEKVTGKPYETLMQELLFDPLGMTSAGFGPPGEASKLDQPWGHQGQPGSFKPIAPGRGADNPAAIAPAGTVHCTLRDWAKFVAMHTAGPGRPGRLLKPETLKKLHAPPAGQEYALGWAATRRAWGGEVFTHAGSNTMWYCVVWASPEKDFAVLAACNCAGDTAPKACDEAAAALIRLHQEP